MDVKIILTCIYQNQPHPVRLTSPERECFWRTRKAIGRWLTLWRLFQKYKRSNVTIGTCCITLPFASHCARCMLCTKFGLKGKFFPLLTFPAIMTVYLHSVNVGGLLLGMGLFGSIGSVPIPNIFYPNTCRGNVSHLYQLKCATKSGIFGILFNIKIFCFLYVF